MYSNALELADRHVTETLAVIKEMGSRGIRVDRDKLDKFNSDCDFKIDELQKKFDADPLLVPFRSFSPPTGYKKPPKDTTGLVLASFVIRLGENGKEVKSKKEPWVEEATVERWARRNPFKALNGKSVIGYSKSQGHGVKLSTDKETGETKETSDQKGLLLAWRKYKDEHYRDFVEYRKVRKIRGTYGKWPLTQRGEDWYATTTYTLKPETNRLSSVNPNLQNIPKEGPLADGFRACLVPSRGCRLIKADFGSAEAIILAWMTGDPLLMRIARLGMHKYVMARRRGLAVDFNKSDAELSKFFDEVRAREPEAYKFVKNTVYGSFYLAGAKTIFERYIDIFESQAQVKEIQADVFRALPVIRDWQQDVTMQRAKWSPTRRWGWIGNRLYNPFGYSIEYWDMRGSDGPAACAFLPQSTIGSAVKECMLQLRPMTAGRYMSMQIHDELVFDTPEGLILQVKGQVAGVMGQPWAEMNGLRIPVEIKVVESL